MSMWISTSNCSGVTQMVQGARSLSQEMSIAIHCKMLQIFIRKLFFVRRGPDKFLDFFWKWKEKVRSREELLKLGNEQ